MEEKAMMSRSPHLALALPTTSHVVITVAVVIVGAAMR